MLTYIKKLLNIGKTMGKSKRKGNIITRKRGHNMNKNVNHIPAKGQFGATKNTPVVVKGSPVAGGNVPKGGGITIVGARPAAPSYWETDIEMVKCGALTQAVDITISQKARSKMNVLMGKFNRIEWLAYLVGDKETGYIKDIVIPKQRVTSVNVYVDGSVNVPTIGVIHSHHDMGNNFSHTDDEYINGNHDISLCISHTGIKGHVRVKTECGRYALATANVKDEVVNFDASDFMKEISDNITEQSFTYHRPGSVAMGHYGYDDISEVTVGKAIDPNARNILGEVKDYQDSIKGVVLDEDFRIEFINLANMIDAIGTDKYTEMEDAAFDDQNRIFTENYYRLIDEISLGVDDLTDNEKKALKGLAAILDKTLEVEDASEAAAEINNGPFVH